MRYFDENEKIKKETRLAKYPKFLQRLFNSIPTVHDVYDDVFKKYVCKENVLLDAGCGKKGILNKYKGQFKYAVGMDLSAAAVQQNTSLDSYVLGNLEYIPFPDNTFDIIISQWVVEHMSDPEECFREFYRVLKKGGGLILVTNSIYHPIMFFSSIFPEGFRDKIKNRVLPPEIEEDTFPTYYKCNTLKRIERVLTAIGFTKVFDAYVGDASFFIFSKFLFPFLLVYEKITDLPFLRIFKMHIVIHYIK